MNRIMGLEALYWLGLDPSRTPPCGAALSVEVGDADDDTAVTVRVAIEVAMPATTGPTNSSRGKDEGNIPVD
jgi:hypothetical protein